MTSGYELLVEGTGGIVMPCVLDGVQWTTERRGAPGKLTFTTMHGADIREGDRVRLRKGGANIFYGFVFTLKGGPDTVAVTAYDQLRYLKNRDTYVYANKTASDVIRMVASDFQLNLGEIADTGYVIPSRVEDNTALFDVIYNALDLELTNRSVMYVLYDDCGRLTLKPLEMMKIDVLIDAETGEKAEYKTTIDESTYNRVKLSYENDETGKRDIYIAQDGKRMNEWGVLQYYAVLQEGEDGAAKADGLLSLYCHRDRSLKLTGVFGDCRMRAGSMPAVRMELGGFRVNNRMLVEKCVHTFGEGDHRMDLTMRGGELDG